MKCNNIIIVTLQDIIDDNDILIKETKMNYIKLDQLNPNTAYELKVFVETHTGYNIDYFLSANFTTKIKSESNHNYC